MHAMMRALRGRLKGWRSCRCCRRGAGAALDVEVLPYMWTWSLRAASEIDPDSEGYTA